MTDTSLITDGANNTDAGQQQKAPQSDAAQTAQEQGAQPQQQQQPEGNAQPEQKDGEAKQEGTEAKEAEKEGAPEKYEFKSIEGVQLDGAVLGKYSEVAKELNLTQDAAQNVLDKMAPLIASRQAEVLQNAVSEWKQLSATDKEFGGDKVSENLAVAEKALSAFGTPELRTLLVQTGLGNHPEIIRAFYRVGRTISEDKMVTRNGAGKADVDPAKVLFPTMN